MQKTSIAISGALVAVTLTASSGAAAQFRPAGAISGHALLSSSARLDGSGAEAGYGGGLLADVSAPFGVVRVGGAIGFYAITSEADEASRVLMPVALSLAIVLRPAERLWLDVHGRAGVWAGATNQGLAAGPYFDAGVFAGYGLSDRVAIGASLDAVFALTHGDTIGFAPGVALLWTPASDG